MFDKIFSGLWAVIWFIPSYFFSFIWYIFSLIYRIVYPDYNRKKIAALKPIVQKINDLREEFSKLTNAELKNKTNEFKERLKNNETLDDLLVEAFATVKEASKRITGYEHYDEQLMAGIVLYRGCMTEMKTGEGKTLAATTAVYLHALSGKSVHVATVNDYLAKRDSDEMGRIYAFLGLSCGALLEQMNIKEKQLIYSLDIIYATGSSLGFDYLYDNMANRVENICQRELSFVIVDEADKLLDDGSTPMIISSSSEDSLEYYSYLMDVIRKEIKTEDYEVDVTEKSVYFKESGLEKIQKALLRDGVLAQNETVYDYGLTHYAHGLNQCLHAEVMMKKNYDYIVDAKGEVLLVDIHTGRILDGRRLSHGLHQALEAKEGVQIHQESKTSASISYQKFFNLYQKFSGMSGTCLNEAEEFYEIYGVDTVSIPTHKPVIREDLDDEIYIDFEDKFDAIVKEVQEAQEKQQPVLVITGSVDVSEIFAKKFRSLSWKVNVLNAKRHKEEADIIAQAGMPKAITIATNMAGRGTDIQLGGNYESIVRDLRSKGVSEAEIQSRSHKIKADIQKNKDIVLAAGGLYVIGTERNESRRVDDQARGRAGRQGDPGKSKFMISLDDPIMKNFSNSGWMKSLMTKGEAIKDSLITRQVEKAQRLVEARSFDGRKYLLKYDSVLDEQRTMIYAYRHNYLFDDVYVVHQLEQFVQQKLELFNAKMITEASMKEIFGEEIQEDKILIKTKAIPASLFKNIILRVLDELWSNHLSNISYVKQVTQLRAHGEKDPLVEYKIEASKLFENLLEELVNETLKQTFNHEIIKSIDWNSKSVNSFNEEIQNALDSEEVPLDDIDPDKLAELRKLLK